MHYKVSIDYIEHYQQLDIQADSKEQAQEIYLEKVADGEVLSVSGDYCHLRIEKDTTRCPKCGSINIAGNGDNTIDCMDCEYHYHETEV